MNKGCRRNMGLNSYKDRVAPALDRATSHCVQGGCTGKIQKPALNVSSKKKDMIAFLDEVSISFLSHSAGD